MEKSYKKSVSMKSFVNKLNPFRWVRNIVWDIQFRIKEFKLEEEVEREIEHAEGYGGHGMHGFLIYKQYQQEREERKRQHKERKRQ